MIDDLAQGPVPGDEPAEIAEKMNISEKTVEGHLTKGLKLIRMNLRDSGILSVLISSSIHQLLQ